MAQIRTEECKELKTLSILEASSQTDSLPLQLTGQCGIVQVRVKSTIYILYFLI